MRVVMAPDKFRGTATAHEIAAGMVRGANAVGVEATAVPMSDGGEGTLEVLGGPNRQSTVTGPLGTHIGAEWRFDGQTAVIEMARASGLLLAGGPENNDPLQATTAGTGELIKEAAESGAQRIVVALGGSASTDGGLGAIRAMGSLSRYRGIELIVACDVRTQFLDAAQRFAPQKGASASQVEMLRRRLVRLAQQYHDEFGIDISGLAYSGAAGGLAGGLAAIGADLVEGVDLIAQELRLDEIIDDADLLITGEGQLDISSYEGKVVGGVSAYAAAINLPVRVIAGRIHPDVSDRSDAVSLTERFGEKRPFTQVVDCVSEVVSELVSSLVR